MPLFSIPRLLLRRPRVLKVYGYLTELCTMRSPQQKSWYGEQWQYRGLILPRCVLIKFDAGGEHLAEKRRPRQKGRRRFFTILWNTSVRRCPISLYYIYVLACETTGGPRLYRVKPRYDSIDKSRFSLRNPNLVDILRKLKGQD